MGFGVLEKELSRKVNIEEFHSLKETVKSLEARIDQLLKEMRGEPEKEFYSVKDVAKLLSKAETTVRKNYIKPGIIKAFRPAGSNQLLIEKEEFDRVKDIVFRKGVSFLRLEV